MENVGMKERDLGNGVYHRAIISPIIHTTKTHSNKKQHLTWKDEPSNSPRKQNGKASFETEHVNGTNDQSLNGLDDQRLMRTKDLSPNGTHNRGFSNSHNCIPGTSSCFLEIRRDSLQNGNYSGFKSNTNHPKNFYIRRHSDYIELMKSRRLESLRKNIENKQRAESSVALLEQFRDRDKPFKNRLDYFSVALTFVIGLGNVLRFSHLCHQHGGGAFFIPYFVMLIFEGIPLTCLELAVGQRYGKASLFKAWNNLVPSLRGLGLSAFAVNLTCVFYYNVLVSWCLYYAVQSLRDMLIWEPCSLKANRTFEQAKEEECIKAGSEKYFWYRESLNAAKDINQFSGLNMFMYAFVAISWLVVFLLSMKLLRKTAKVFLVILIVIVVNLVIFFFVAVELEGWAEGLAMLFTVENLEPLKDIKVWMEAGGQVFFSLSIGYGGLTLFSSGNKWNNDFCSDALVISIANSATSLWASIIMFSFFGFHMNFEVEQCRKTIQSNNTAAIAAFMLKENIEGSATLMGLETGTKNCSSYFFYEKIPGGMSMAFIGMTRAFGQMNPSSAYACLFFFLLFFLGATSLPTMLHVLINSFYEWKVVPKRCKREIVAGVICLVLCLSNLLYVQSTGLYILELIDNASAFPLLVIAFTECIGVSYIYGIDKFSKDLFVMTSKKINWKWKICWMVISPLIVLGLIIGSLVNMVQQGRRTYSAWNSDKGHLITLPYPPWATFLYFFITLLPVICLVYPFIQVCFKKIKTSNMSQGSFLSCGSCASIIEACREKFAGRSGTYDLTSPKNLIGFENNAFELNGVHSDDTIDGDAVNESHDSDKNITSHSRDSGYHSHSSRHGNHSKETDDDQI